jgi:hypothetical protein
VHIFSKQTSLFLLFVSLVVSLSADANDTVLQKAKTNKPVVLNTVKPQPWQHDSETQFQYHVGIERAGTLTLGLMELWAGVGLTALTVYAAAVEDCDRKVRLPLSSMQYSIPSAGFIAGEAALLFFDGRMLYGGALNIYNACASARYQATMRTKTRWWLGVAELSTAFISGACLLAAGSSVKVALTSPGTVLALFGAYDLIRASDEKGQGINIARF